jgi:hypothetical protein
MNDQTQGMDLGFTTEFIPDCNHICLIYDSDEERQEIVSTYLAAGIKQGELVRYFADETPPHNILAWLSEKGIEYSEVEEGESFRILEAAKAYCPSGRFEPRQVLDNMVSRYAMARQAGYRGSRVTGEMTWALRAIPGSERLLEYEMGINAIHDVFPHVGMCQYDARLFDGAMLFKVLQVHPYMVARGQIVRSPFYFKLEESI